MWQIIWFELSRLWKSCGTVEVQGRRLRNANLCFSCQLHCFEHGLCWINSNQIIQVLNTFRMQQFQRAGGDDVGLHVYWQTLSSPATLILLEFGIQPQALSAHNGWYNERWLDGDLDHNVLSYVIHPPCWYETKLSLTLLPVSDPWTHTDTELMSEDLLWHFGRVIEEHATRKTDAGLLILWVERVF